MGLDVGGFISGLKRDNDIRNTCQICGRDKREPRGTIRSTTEIKQYCSECKRPIVWISTNPHSGKREVHEQVRLPSGHFKEVVTTEKNSQGVRISFD